MKKFKNLILLSFSIIILSVSCEKNNTELSPDPNIPIIELTKKGKTLVSSDNIFGFDLIKQINSSEESNKNIMVSPLSVSLALSMTYNGADKETKEAMEETLKLNGLTIEEINESRQHLINSLTSLDNDVLLSIANSIWYRNTFEVEQSFIDINSYYYNAEVSSLDFSDANSKNIINNWVADNTNDKITKIIDEITPSNVMFLINAIYFKGVWKYQFEEEDTQNNYTFHLQDGSTEEVSMMVQRNTINYFSNDLFEAVELPYGIGKYSMLVLLPKNENNVNDIVEQVNADNWNNWLNSFYTVDDLQVYLPKFKYEYEKTLNEVLTNMGMGVAFDTEAANFSKINPNYDLYIDYVKHKTFIEVNEEGTEAAAVTVVAINLTSAGGNYPESFIANKPFIFVIKEKDTNSIIFIGKVMNPVNE